MSYLEHALEGLDDLQRLFQSQGFCDSVNHDFVLCIN